MSNWSHFTPMLHEDDDDLDAYQYRLLGHYRRLCGANGHICTETTDETAKNTRMSSGKVCQARKQLESLGRIKLIPVGRYIHVGLVERWKENRERYNIVHEMNDEQDIVHHMSDKGDDRSPHEHNVHHMNDTSIIDSIDSNTESEQQKNNNKEKDSSAPEKSSLGEQYVEGLLQSNVSKKNPLQESIAFTFQTNPGGWAGMLGAQLTGSNACKGKRAEWKVDEPPMTPLEIVAFGIWYKAKYEGGKPPTTAETLYERVMEFRSSGGYRTAMQKAERKLRELLGIPEEPPPAEDEGEPDPGIDIALQKLSAVFGGA